MDYYQWHSSAHFDEPLDQERELNTPDPDHHYWASIGPDNRRKTGEWSWTILEFDGADNREEASGLTDSEQSAKKAVSDWEISQREH